MTRLTSREFVAIVLGGAIDGFGKLGLGLLDRLMETVAARAFEDEEVGGVWRFGIANDGEVLAANVAGKEQAGRPSRTASRTFGRLRRPCS